MTTPAKPPRDKATPDTREPYEKPQVVAEERFETLALACLREGFLCLSPDKS